MIIGLAGYARSGKSTVAERLCNKHGFEAIAFADALKQAVLSLDPFIPLPATENLAVVGSYARLSTLLRERSLEEAKVAYPEVRRLLQVFGTEVGRNMMGQNVWVDIALRKIELAGDRVVLPDVRFPNEVEAVAHAGGRIFWVERPGVGPLPGGHASENSLDPGKFRRILNTGTLEDLNRYVDGLIEAGL